MRPDGPTAVITGGAGAIARRLGRDAADTVSGDVTRLGPLEAVLTSAAARSSPAASR